VLLELLGPLDPGFARAQIILSFVFTVAGRVIDGREIMVQFAKYGPNAEVM
jgi:hypothetical protein